MNKTILTVARFEIMRQLKKPAFWASILLMPVLIAVIFLVSFVAGENAADIDPTLGADTTVAITDDAGILPANQPFARYSTKEAGINAVKTQAVDLFYYIPADFAETKTAEFYHISEGLEILNYDANILKGILREYASVRVDELDVLALTGDYEITDNRLTLAGEESNALGKAIIPIAILLLFFMFVALFGNRFLLAVVEEKENRVSEMILTAVSAKHLITGKIVAMMALGIIQMLTVIIPVIILVLLNHDNTVVSYVLSTIEIDPVAITMNVILFIASVFFYAGTCMFIGSLVSTARDASSFIGPAIIAMVFPLYFMQAFLATTPGFMVYFLSYFPLSAPIALMLRSSFGTLGTGEFVIGLIEVTALAIVMVTLAVKTFQKTAISFETMKLFKRK